MLTLGNIHASMTLRSFTRIGVHEALVLVQRLSFGLIKDK
jgi:hypothetical protein